MTDTLAAKHADQLAADIQRMTDAGAPYGLISESEEWTNDADAYADWQDNPESEYREASVADYLADVLDILYVVNGNRSYRSARILISFGGPNVWIDTHARRLEVHWDGVAYRDLPHEFTDGLDDALAELWEVGA